jgi:hypothetical protein
MMKLAEYIARALLLPLLPKLAEAELWTDVTAVSQHCLEITVRYDLSYTGYVDCQASTTDGSFETDWRPYHQDLIASETVAIGSNHTRICRKQASAGMALRPGQMWLRCATEGADKPREIALAWNPARQWLRSVTGAADAFVVLWAEQATIPRLRNLTLHDTCVRALAGWAAGQQTRMDFCLRGGVVASRPRGADVMAIRGGFLYIGDTSAQNKADGDSGPETVPVHKKRRLATGARLRRIREIATQLSFAT